MISRLHMHISVVVGTHKERHKLNYLFFLYKKVNLFTLWVKCVLTYCITV